MAKKSISKDFAVKQIARLSSMPYFSGMGELGLEELARVLAEGSVSEWHAREIISIAARTKFGEDGRCPSSQELWALCLDTPQTQAETEAIKARESESIPGRCPACAQEGDWLPGTRKIQGVDYDFRTRCKCERGRYLLARDKEQAPGWNPDRSVEARFRSSPGPKSIDESDIARVMAGKARS